MAYNDDGWRAGGFDLTLPPEPQRPTTYLWDVAVIEAALLGLVHVCIDVRDDGEVRSRAIVYRPHGQDA